MFLINLRTRQVLPESDEPAFTSRIAHSVEVWVDTDRKLQAINAAIGYAMQESHGAEVNVEYAFAIQGAPSNLSQERVRLYEEAMWHGLAATWEDISQARRQLSLKKPRHTAGAKRDETRLVNDEPLQGRTFNSGVSHIS